MPDEPPAGYRMILLTHPFRWGGISKMFERKTPVVGKRGVHLDLKGLPPKPGRLMEFLDIFSAAKFNCILVEWEDCYPWMTYRELRSEACYSLKDVEAFLKKADELSIEVIPLVQSFGHLENVLYKKKFYSLREDKDYGAAICPSHGGSRTVIINMLRDVLATHGGKISRFHLGGDEVRRIGSCRECRKKVEKSGKNSLYLEHILPIVNFLRGEGLTPIIWDDMLRGWGLGEIKKLQGSIELMAWEYSEDIFGGRLEKKNIDKYVKAGIPVWGASSFRGGDQGKAAEFPDAEKKVKNTYSWVMEQRRSGLRGIIATGWGRSSSFKVPYYGMEVSLPSLVLAGSCMWDGKINSITHAFDFLTGNNMKMLSGPSFMECIESAKDVSASLQEVNSKISDFSRLAAFSCEPERIDVYYLKEIVKVIDELLDSLSASLKRWKKARKGLIEEHWLNLYVKSRFVPSAKLLNVFREWALEEQSGNKRKKLHI